MRARDHGLTTLRLGTRHEPHEAQHLYERHGYR
jgi:ribosomal protein S18 acetylase RimI-like enzyme